MPDSVESRMDNLYVQRMIQEEQSRIYQRWINAQPVVAIPTSTANSTSSAVHQVQHAASGTGLYQPIAPSNATPMERFLTPSPADDPSGFLFRPQMQDAGIAYGSYESMEKRMILPRQWTQQQEAELQEKSSSMEAQASESGRHGQGARSDAGDGRRLDRVNAGNAESS